MSKMFILYETYIGHQGRIDLQDWHDGMSEDIVDTIGAGKLSEEGNHNIALATLHIVHPDGSRHMRNYTRSGKTWVLSGRQNLFSDKDGAILAATLFGGFILMFVVLYFLGVK
jgi:hypothetical protein